MEVLTACARSDYIIIDMVTIIEEMLEQDKQERPSAKDLRRRCQKALKKADDLLATGGNSYPPAFRTTSEFHLQPRTPPEPPPRLDRRGLGIHVSPSGVVNGSGSPEPLGKGFASLPSSARQSELDHNYALSIDSLASERSPSGSHGFENSAGSPQYSSTQQFVGAVGKRPATNEPGSHTGSNGIPTAGSITRNDEVPFKTQTQPQHSETKRHTTIDEVHSWILKKKSGARIYSTFEDLLTLRTLRNRDQVCIVRVYLTNAVLTKQIFLIDDSLSMKEYWPQVRKTFEVLGYIVKCAGPNGIELFFTDSKGCYRHKDRKRLLRHFDAVQLRRQGDMGPALSRILDQCMKSRPWEAIGIQHKSAVNIYVLTDGVWNGEDGSLCGIPDAIKQTVEKMATKNSIGIQFIQFGHNQTGTRRLETLDDGLGSEVIM